jgi:hypothetical protein
VGDKFLVKYTTPLFLFKHFFNDLSTCSTHHDALNTLDLIQLLITIIDETKFGLDLVNSIECMNNELASPDEYDIEFYTKNSLKYYLNRNKCDWHLALNRFTSIQPSAKSKSDQLLFSNSFKTIFKMLNLQLKFNEKGLSSGESFGTNLNETIRQSMNGSLIANNNNQLALLTSLMNRIDSKNDLENMNSLLLIDKWLFGMIYNPTSTLLAMIKNLLLNYEADEANTK